MKRNRLGYVVIILALLVLAFLFYERYLTRNVRKRIKEIELTNKRIR